MHPATDHTNGIAGQQSAGDSRARILKRFGREFVPVFILLVLLLGSLNMMSDATQSSQHIGSMYSWLLGVNTLGLLVLLILIGRQIVRLYNQYRNQAAGSRLTVRVVSLLVVFSLAPVAVVYYYSQQFLHRGIDNWLDIQTEQAFDRVLVLGRASLDLHMRQRLDETEQIAAALAPLTEAEMAVELAKLRARFDAQELILLSGSSGISSAGRILAYSHVDRSEIVPDLPRDDLLLQIRGTENYVGLDPVDENQLFIRTVVNAPAGGNFVLHGLFPVPERLASLVQEVQSDYTRYKELSFLRKPLKDTFTLTLRLVLLFSVLSALWAAFYSVSRVTSPIRDLAEGTRAVADGDYDKQLPMPRKNDLGFLVKSFNDMTRRLAQARDQAKRSQQQVEEQRAYLEAVLEQLSSGVLTLDSSARLRTVNKTAESILGADLHLFVGYPVSEVPGRFPNLQYLVEALLRHLAEQQEWQEEIRLPRDGGHRILLCRSTPFRTSKDSSAAHVLVIDDITELVQAQHESAWSEVARRLAHEFKNPLTPIQLSAERLRRKCLPRMAEEDARLLDRSTETIVQQVKTLLEMVNSFSEYARLPLLEPQPVDFNRLIVETVELYRGSRSPTPISTDLAADLPIINADPSRLRQVLHNLLKNALEATKGNADRAVSVRSRRVEYAGIDYIECSIEDNGPGFPEEIEGRVFEPYVTTKRKGTGLGLAIVKKILEEHGGQIETGNQPAGGARVVFRLPVQDFVPGSTHTTGKTA